MPDGDVAMSCKRYREAITDTIAAGDAQFSTELAAHLETCGTCHSFYQAQSSLLRTIDSGLQVIVNRDLPASFLPGLQTRMERQSTQARARILDWSLPAAAAVLLVLVLSFIRNHPRSTTTLDPPASPLVDASVVRAPSPKVENHRRLTALSRRRIEKPVHSPVEKTEAPDIATEVIVLAEEREAFARFVAVLPMQNEVAVALTHPAPSKPDPPVQIALLQIRVVEVAPLEGMIGK
jgi:hypothetical protein